MVFGNSLTATAWHAFVWTKKDGMVDLGTLGDNASSTSVVGSGSFQSSPVNNAGAVVGQTDTAEGLAAFVWTKQDGMVALETPAGAYDCGAQAINDAGVILGVCATDDGHRATVWMR
jgi:probable HAF family extracellular repeat protein